MMKKNVFKIVVPLILLLSCSYAMAEPLYYTYGFAGNTTEQAGAYYYGGYSYMKEYNGSTSTTIISDTRSTYRMTGLDVADINGTQTMFYCGDYNSTNADYLYRKTWNGSSWANTETVFTRSGGSDQAISDVAIISPTEVYMTIDGKGVANSYVYKLTYNSSTSAWDTSIVMNSNNTNLRFMGVTVGDIDKDGTPDMFLSTWYGPTYLDPDIRQYKLVDDAWAYQGKAIDPNNSQVAKGLAIGDYDGDGSNELLYVLDIYGAGYSYIKSAEWNGTGFDSSISILTETNTYIDYEGVAMMHSIVPEPSMLSLLAIGVVSLIRRNKRV